MPGELISLVSNVDDGTRVDEEQGGGGGREGEGRGGGEGR